MKVVYTEDALSDLDAIADWLIVHYPAVAPAIERRVRSAVANIALWPESARRVAGDTLEILHIHHAARRPWDERT
jgi:toxin ParE1/3/4